ncbi:MAG: two-component regulator propeller domain-containing protein [Bacteroidota bacterium]
MWSCVIGLGQVSAQRITSPQQLKFSSFGKGDGLSDPVILDIEQDSTGFIWLGTENGLNRFDGKQFVPFYSNPTTEDALPSNIITALERGEGHSLWIGTQDAGICHMDTRTNQIKRIPCIIEGDTISNLSVQDFEWDGNRLWVATFKQKLIHYIPKEQTWYPAHRSLKGKYTPVVQRLSDGSILAGLAGKGLQQIKPEYEHLGTGALKAGAYAPPAQTIQAILEDRKGRIWCGAWDNGLHELRADHRIHSLFLHPQGRFSHDSLQIHSLVEVEEGMIWLGTDQGEVWQFDAERKTFARINGFPIPVRRIRKIFCDKKDNIWIGTDQGVFFYAKANDLFSPHYLPSLPLEEEIGVRHFFQAGDSMLWIGTDQGLYQQPLSNGEIRLFAKELSITAFFPYRDRFLFIGTKKAVYRLNLRTNQLELAIQRVRYSEKAWDPNDLIASSFSTLTAFALGRDTMIWAGAYGWQTLVIHPEERWASFIGLSLQSRHTFFTDAQHRLFLLSKTEGLACDPTFWDEGDPQEIPSPSVLKPGTFAPEGKTFLYRQHWQKGQESGLWSNHLGAIIQTSNNHYWLTSPSSGLYEWRTERYPPFRHIPLPFHKMGSLCLDHHDHLWIITNGELLNYIPQNSSFRLFGPNEGLPESGLQGKLYQNHEGLIFAGGPGYWLTFHPDSLQEQDIQADLVLTTIACLDRSLVPAQKTYQFSESDRNYRFGFSALEFAQPDAISYQYQLKGLSDNWVELGHQQEVQFGYLPSGNYAFSVRALAYDGELLSELNPVSFSVQSLWYKSWWFQMIWVSIVLGIGWALYQWRQRMRKKADEVRNHIARDLHDDLGSTLGSISIFSEAAQSNLAQGSEETTREILHLIGRHSRETLSYMRDMIWAVNPEKDQVSELLEKMESFARNTLSSAQIKLHFHSDNWSKDQKLDMNTRKNVFLIYKELVYNLIKHSESKVAHISIRAAKDSLMVQIQDEGIGYDSSAPPSGNGLKNIQQRISEVNGELKVATSPGQGCQTNLQVPI